MPEARIVVIGSANTDMVVKVPELPKAGETVLGGRFFQVCGGKGANQAVAVARSGGTTIFVAKVGKDTVGDWIIRNLQEAGVGCEFVGRDEEAASGVALILVDENGENLIAVAPGANSRLEPSDVDLCREVIERASLLLLQMEIPLETVFFSIETAHRFRVPVLLNPAPAPSEPIPDEVLARISILTPNESELAVLSGRSAASLEEQKNACRALLEKGVKTVVLTRGSRGILLVTKDMEEEMPAFQVKAVDSVAAGDCFAGALAVSVAEGQGIKEACRFASAAAAISVTREGAQPSLPTRDEIESFLKESRLGC